MARTTGAVTGVTIPGWREFVRDISKADKRMRRDLGRDLKQISGGLAEKSRRRMIREAKGRGGTLGALGIKASGATTKPGVVLDGRSNPRVLGDEFGSRAFSQFRPWRGNQWTMARNRGRPVGYAVHRVIWESHDHIVDQMQGAYVKHLKKLYSQ